MDRDCVIDRMNTESFYGGLLGIPKLIQELGCFGIDARDFNGDSESVEQLLIQLQRISKLHWHPSDSRRISDMMQTLIYALSVDKYIEDSVQVESEELNLFLGSFKIRNSVEVSNG